MSLDSGKKLRVITLKVQSQPILICLYSCDSGWSMLEIRGCRQFVIIAEQSMTLAWLLAVLYGVPICTSLVVKFVRYLPMISGLHRALRLTTSTHNIT